MSFIQRLISALVPSSTGRRIEAESRTWMLRCPAGRERSVWEAGGIRAGAVGKKKTLVRCPQCGKLRWHTLYRTWSNLAPQA